MRDAMKKTLFSVLAAVALTGQVHADPLDQGSAARFVDTFYQAVQKHDLTAVSGMIDDKASIQVQWLDASPVQTFTLSKADFLQQLRATWHFATNDNYELKNLSVEQGGNDVMVSVQENESRILFGSKAGQRNQLQIHVTGESDNPRIAAINSKTSFW
jgi:hypothetical protein